MSFPTTLVWSEHTLLVGIICLLIPFCMLITVTPSCTSCVRQKKKFLSLNFFCFMEFKGNNSNYISFSEIISAKNWFLLSIVLSKFIFTGMNSLLFIAFWGEILVNNEDWLKSEIKQNSSSILIPMLTVNLFCILNWVWRNRHFVLLDINSLIIFV